MLFTLDNFHNRLVCDWRKGRNNWRTNARNHAKEHNHAGAWQANDSFILFYNDKGSIKQKTFKHAKPIN